MAEPKSLVDRPDYGIDAPGVIRNLLVAALAGTTTYVTARLGWWSGIVGHVDLAHSALWAGGGCAFMAAWMVYDSRIGKLRERDRLLDRIAWTGAEQVLDIGCGRGLMLIGAAKRLTSGRATGLDLWQAEDLTGNRPGATLANAKLEGVAGRVAVQTGDMREMPFASASFDVVVSNVAIHNVYEAEGRDKTMKEIARVLRPGGRLVIHDIRHTPQYAARLAAEGLVDVRRVGSALGRWFFTFVTFGSLRPDIVTARKPSA